MWLSIHNSDIKGSRIFTLIFLLTETLHICYGQSCQMEGVTFWPVPVSEEIWDWYRGEVTNRTTTNIEGINSISYGGGLNRGPYLDVALSNSRFIMSTNDEYPLYEEYETSETISLTINFSCAGGTSNNLVFIITVMDSNNNPPLFRPSDELEFTVMPPLPPGYLVTGCLNSIIVRDIDLTTMRIDFDVEDNPYFEIAYDSTVSTAVKEFAGVLRTKTFIRSLPEPIFLTIYATDVDATNDPPITNSTEIRITSDIEFEMPEEPVFSETFYLATYTKDDQVTLQNSISLQQGYDELVTFSLEGAYVNYFELIRNGNQLSLAVRTPLPTEIIMERQIFLIVKADREYTSGSSATIILELPEDVSLDFERTHYTGSITDNTLSLTPIILSQGYEGAEISALIFGEYSSNFNSNVQGNIITLTMAPLNENVIAENSFIYLQLVASNGRSSARAVITLEIVKDDNVTPVFNQVIYNGNYSPTSGLDLDQILIMQGFDDNVEVILRGDYVNYFQIVQVGPAIDLQVTTLPIEIYSEGQIVLSIEAIKPRTVGANAAIIITLPAARQLEFESSTYRGVLQDNVLALGTITLSGYDESVEFNLAGDYSEYFAASNVLNQVTISLPNPLPTTVIEENNTIILTLHALGINAIPTSTTIILDIIKADTKTPIFSQNIYHGTYTESSIEIQDINLIQGYDETVIFRIEGVHSQYFAISNTGNNVILSMQSAVPEDIVFNEKVLSFNILAEKPLTVGANAAVLISFPKDLTDTVMMRFAQNSYIGVWEDNVLTLENIVLNEGYASGTEFRLSGDHSEYFTLSSLNNVITLTTSTLPPEIVENSNFILLEIEAQRERAMPVTTIVLINILKEDVKPLVFSEPYYRGVYTEEVGLLFDEHISLTNGYDEAVEFELDGDYAVYFELVQVENSLTIINIQPLSEDILAIHNHLLFTVTATRPNAFDGYAVISIDLPKDNPEAVVLRFTETSYIGSYNQGQLELPIITLLENFEAYLNISGEYASYFSVSRVAEVIRVGLISELPGELINQNPVIILNLEAYYPDSISGYTTIVIEVISRAIDMPVFDQAYYSGEYSIQSGFWFEYSIRLMQGYDETVTFTLAGDDSQWFGLEIRGENDLSLTVINDGIQTMEGRSHLSFTVEANKPGSLLGSAVIIVSLTDNLATRSIRFAQDFYTGTIENDLLTIDPISLEGYSSDVTYNLIGDYSNYFQLSNEAGVFTLRYEENFHESITSDVIIFTFEATIDNRSRTHTTIIIELASNIDREIGIVFEENYYVGSYSEANGFTFESDIRLVDGYPSDVIFALSGDGSQWFELVQAGNSMTIGLTSPIPPAIVATHSHIIFVISAQRLGSSIASATIIITLTDEFTGDTILGFERINYQGTIENDVATLEPITLIQGYSNNVAFALNGELESHFSLSAVGDTVTVALRSAIPEQLIPSNGIIVLELQATAPAALTAYTTVVFAVVSEENAVDEVVDLVFSNPYYTGGYNDADGLTFENVINLSQGYDETVLFALEGEHSQWFELVQTANSLTLRLSSPIPPAVVASNQQLLFVVSAQRPGSVTARATIIITLADEFTGDTILGFERINYQGTIENDMATLEPITLIQGYSNNVAFALSGELESYFSLSAVGATVTVALRSAIPEQLIPSNGIIVLELQATAPAALTAYTTVVFTVVAEEIAVDEVVDLVFNNPYYTGRYNDADGLMFENIMSLSQGYDETVLFALEGEQSQWFDLDQTGNSLTLRLSSPIPPAVVASNLQLVFVVSAQRTGSVTARSTIIITLADEFTGDTILGFERINYQGTIENDVATLEPITLIQGYSSNVNFALSGELESYFSLSAVGATVTVALRSAIPEQLIPSNGVIVLELQATAPAALTAYTTVVFTVVTEEIAVDEVVDLVFNNPYYTGRYNDADGLMFDNVISLSQGYDETVWFALEGEHSQWFELVQTANSLTLRLSSPIPPAVVASNQQLVFVVSAQRPGSVTARATIIITLADEFTGDTILGFERINYQGTIENDVATLEPITLIQGYSNNVNFALSGELESYFSLSAVGATVTVALRSAIPEQLIPSNGIIVLELQATAPAALTAYTTVVFTVVAEEIAVDEVVDLVFNNPYYTGRYNDADGLMFENVMSLSQGYDETVLFALEGEQSQWFDLDQTGNSLTLRLSSPIPPAVVASNLQLVFVVSAQRTGSVTARSTIIITLADEFTGDTILGFERINYQGTIENDVATLEPITLIQGYSNNVNFALSGELESYFSLSAVGATVTVALRSDIPEQLIPSNGVIVLELQATAPAALTAYTTVVFTVVAEEIAVDEVVDLVFNNPYYTGRYNDAGGLMFDNVISLSQGYDETVWFALEGEHSQWFELVQTANSLTLRLSSPIPPAVVASNQQLVFVVSAQRPGSVTARATIIITLADEFTGDTILGFERINYQGTIENDMATLEPITLIQGYSNNVAFALSGELEFYFSLSAVGATVTVALRSAIPEQLIPSNGIIVLELQATAPAALTAYTTVVFTVVAEEIAVDEVVDLVFNNPYYTGRYNDADGLMFENVMSLSQGYDETVLFALEGEQSQWFDLDQTGNSLTLRLSSPIPPAVVASNLQLVFVVSAQRTGSVTARSTIIITLADEFTGDTILGFERINYQGTIENDVATLEPITLIQGYSNNVNFALSGELESYFSLSAVGATVTVALRSDIPEQLIPSNGVIVLELQATAPAALTAYTTVVFTVVAEEIAVDEVVDLVFNNPYYTGRYNDAGGLMFDNVISLSQGYDETVWFALEGEHSQWFELVQTANSLTLRLSSPIPPAVVASNQQLVFVVSAQRPGSVTARATIIITLADEFTGDTILGFERINYQGTIENDMATLEPITLIQGYSNNVAFALSGELEFYFSLSAVGATVTVALRSAIPEQLIPSNGIIVLELQATAPAALTAYTTVVFTVVAEEIAVDEVVDLVFNNPYYTGRYNDADGLMFENVMSLSQGYDETVLFALEGEQSQWFDLDQTGNSLTLRLSSPIPPAVVASNLQLVFVVSAQRTGSVTARSTIIITLADEFTGDTILGFERINYQGTIENDVATLEPITLIQGYSNNVNFALSGELESYFSLSAVGATVTVALRSDIPEQLIPSNGVIVLELQATAPAALTAYTTVVFTVVAEEIAVDEVVDLVFNNPYYTGRYNDAGGLMFDNVISLSQGYDETVWFALEGEHSQWFELVQTANSLTLRLSSPIPPAVVASNQQLVFVVSAQRPGSVTARATIIITLADEFTGDTILGFERINYQGTIENDMATLEPITLIQGYSNNVAFALSGELEFYFSLSAVGATVTVALRSAIPEQLIPSNGIIVLELQATAPAALTAYTTVVFTVVAEEIAVDEVVDLVFNNPYYTGRYNDADGLMFENVMSLSQGYDETVLFALEGEQSQWFDLDQTGNSLTLRLSSPIPPAVVASNLQLVFVVSAQRTGSVTARSTIIITLADEFTGDTILGFERINYQGTIENDVATLEPITLIQGYSNNVNFALSGELESYFSLSAVGATVTVALRSDIPEQLIPSNGVIVLELQATAPAALTAYTTVVFTVVAEEIAVDEVVDLVFNNPYYTGRYNDAGGLMFDNVISLSQGYDETVWFALEGEHSQWFELVQTANSLTLRLSSPIPPAVVASNQQLVFVVSAQRPGSVTARATIIITLADEFTGDTILGFERINYQGTIENDMATLEPITLIQGYSNNVAFALSGELEFYFSLSAVGATVTVALRSAIPEQLIPSNGIIVLELQATAPAALTAYTTVVFTVVAEEIAVDEVVDLVFNNPYYTGRYNDADGLMFENVMSLSQGYDETVLFALEGEQSQWFDLDQTGNSLTLRLSSPIPPAVVASNLQLVFVVSAQRTGSVTARSTIIITLADEFTGDTILGFERINYQGTIENDVATLEPITLIQGYSNNVNFALSGELESYFSLSAVGATVTVALRSDIPEQLIPSNGVIVLELQATAPAALTAYTTVVFTVVAEEIAVDEVVDLVFNNPYYTGRYNDAGGLMFDNVISLSQGYDETVWFALEGEHSQWFELVQTANSLTLRLSSPIPPAVVASNQQLVFVVSAQRPGSVTARATIIITLADEFTGDTILGFERINYQGTIENDMATLEPITLIQGYSNNVAFALSGELEFYFSLSAVGATVTVALRSAIPEQLIPSNGVIVLELQATAPAALTAYTTVVLTVVAEEIAVDEVVDLVFNNPYYTGRYNDADGLMFDNVISLSQGYDETVLFALEGEQSQWFELDQTSNSLILRLSSAIPPAVAASNQQLVFVVSAQRSGSVTARATIIITLADEFTGDTILGFERINYQGTIENDMATLEPITLIQGYSNNVNFALSGELESYFSLSAVGATVTVALRSAIPEHSIPLNGIIVLELQATAPGALTAYATLIFTVIFEESAVDEVVDLVFTNPYYTGKYNDADGLTFENVMNLSQGYDESVQFALEGDQSQWFEIVQSGNSLTLRLSSPIPPAVVASNKQLIFVVSAQRLGSVTVRSTIIITLINEMFENIILGFERIYYLGTMETNDIILDPIVLIQGYSENVAFSLSGDFESYFSLSTIGATVTITLRSAIPEESIPSNGIIILNLQATAPGALTTYASIIITVISQESVDPLTILMFDDTYYMGSYTSGNLIFNSVISLSQGYDASVVFYLEGEQSQWFELNKFENLITLQLSTPIPATIMNSYQKLVFVISAQREGSLTAKATIVIGLIEETQIGVDEYFEKVLYNGVVQNDVVQHQSIRVIGFTGTNIDIVGEYASLFVAYVSENDVLVQRSELDAFPDVTHVAIELHARTARAALILTVVQSDVINQPLVTFSATSYALRSDISQTGLLGRVAATADNGEAVAYSVILDNAHLQSRMSINNEGEIYLSAPADSGVYTFQVVATTVFTQATGSATVYLTVDSVTVCGTDDDVVVPPLIIIDRDEEEPHRNLVVLDATQHEGCWYSLTNRWPSDQMWLYVDDTGLHARRIDREHESIAFMALSQVQVELVLHCNTDDTIRSKRSLEAKLGPYDYGDNKWILTDTIHYNSRRSFVNLIVNDINDNEPIFIGKDQEPLAIGYPIPELIDTVVPRALAEVQATDADIGENAELMYWSSEPVLAVSPSTGFVHVRDGAQLDDGSLLTIHATDQNGDGLTGSINIMVRLLDTSNIVVMTIQDAFLDDEKNITQELSTVVGYDIKVLRSSVISAEVENESDDLRMKRDTLPAGASLQLYIYGLIAREPVTVERLTSDINNIVIATVTITSTVSLEDYLEGREICVIPGRDTGLLVATIILSILLFIILALIAVWYFLKWRKENYDKFSDENSLASRKESFGQLPKVEPVPKMRLNIEDLKRSERRLQEMLDAPIQEVTVEATTSKDEKPYEAILDLPPTDSHVPIVIQSIDKLKDPEEDSDEDEFGERQQSRRKSVVTFNENVEKIIHVEDDEDTGSHLGYEIYKL